MQCPTCGFTTATGNTAYCAHCGQPLPQPPAEATVQYPPAGPATQPSIASTPESVPASAQAPSWGSEPPPAAPTNPPPPAPYGAPAPNSGMGAYGAPAQPSGYGAPAQPSGYGVPGYGVPAQPSGYGAPAQPSGYGMPPYGDPSYGQAAPPSYPLGPGQAYPNGYPQGFPPGYPMMPPPAPKRKTGLIIGIIAAVLVVLVIAACGALYVLGNSVSHNSTFRSALQSAAATETAAAGGADTGTTATATATAGSSETVIYQTSLAPAPADWANDSHCTAASDGYHITAGYECYAPVGNQTDVNITVTVMQISGETTVPYGVSFRRPGEGSHYEFDIDSNGKWLFLKCSNQNCDKVVDYTADPAIQGGLNTSNTLEVRAKGSHFDFYVNGTKVGQADDSALSSGGIGLVGSDNIECVFTNLKITRG